MSTPDRPESPGAGQAPDQAAPDQDTGLAAEPARAETDGTGAGETEKGETEAGETGDAPAVPDRPRYRWPLILGALTVIIGALGVWALSTASQLRASDSQQNVALTDAAATSAVNHQVSDEINTIFSYDYTNTGATRRAAQSALTGPAIRQYDQLFKIVQQDAGQEKLVVTTRVTSSGVEYLTAGSARVLVFADQQDTRAGTTQSSFSGAMLAVTALRRHGRWVIENIQTFGSA